MDGDFPPHELPPPGGGIQLQVSLVLDLEITPGDNTSRALLPSYPAILDIVCPVSEERADLTSALVLTHSIVPSSLLSHSLPWKGFRLSYCWFRGFGLVSVLMLGFL